MAAVVGGSLGGMHALEWAYEGKEYVCCIVPIATCAYQGAWAICWGEAQRHAIYHDSKFHGGRYSLEDPPVAGLEAARMAALLTYRSRDSLERRFSRQRPGGKEKGLTAKQTRKTQPPKNAPDHGHGRMNGNASHPVPRWINGSNDTNDTRKLEILSSNPTFAAQSYLRYQAEKFSFRFDSNCYLALTHKLDTHDLARARADTVTAALALIEQPTLVLGIKTDGLYPFAEQEQLARSIPRATLGEIVSQDGHDAFLIESRQLNGLLREFLYDHLPDLIKRPDGARP